MSALGARMLRSLTGFKGLYIRALGAKPPQCTHLLVADVVHERIGGQDAAIADRV